MYNLEALQQHLHFSEKVEAGQPWFNEVPAEALGLPERSGNRSPVKYLVSRLRNPEDGQRVFRLSPTKYEILGETCARPSAKKELANRRGIAFSTVKNHLTLIYSTFLIPYEPGDHTDSASKLIATLVDLGILEYRPRIPEEKWPILRKVIEDRALAVQNGNAA